MTTTNEPGKIEQLVREDPQGQKWLGDKPVRRAIVAKNGQLVNFVIWDAGRQIVHPPIEQ